MNLDEPQRWGPAEVTFPDFKGTAQLDYKMTGESGFKKAGIDEDNWLVIGFDLGGGEHRHSATVIAVDKALAPEDGPIDWGAIKAEHGHIPVTEFHLHDVEAYELLRSITHLFELRMLRRHFKHEDIRVVAAEDIPEQD